MEKVLSPKEKCTRLLLDLLALEIFGKEVSDSLAKEINEEVLKGLYVLAKQHDLLYALSSALSKQKLLGDTEVGQAFRKQLMIGALRHEKLKADQNGIFSALDAENIPYTPLKGAVMRDLYPDPRARSSCDIDVLVSKDDLERAADVLVSRLSFKKGAIGSHDLSMYSEGGVHVELHYTLCEDDHSLIGDKVLEGVSKYLTPSENRPMMQIMSDEMFYFYHIAHMAKHFYDGGCGIKPFADLRILDQGAEDRTEKRNKLLEEGGLLKFAKVSRALSEVWFGNAEHTPITRDMEQYVISGGVYGSRENYVATHRSEKKGKLSYAMSRIFLPYDTIKYFYPVLQKHKWLTPFMQVRRWFKLIFKGGIKRSVRELEANSGIQRDEADRSLEFLKSVGLK